LKEYTVIEQKLVVVPVESGQTISLNNLFFETASWVLKKESSIELNRVVKILTENPSIKIEIGGHTDNSGDASKNTTLSTNRAKAVLNYLVANGIKADRLTSKGYAATQPLADNQTAEGKAQNRRTEIKLISTN